MANLRIGHTNRADTATITASPVAASGGAVTLLQEDSRDVFLAGASGTQTIRLTWSGTSYSDITELCLYGTNLAATDTVRLYLYSNHDWTGTTLYDSTAVAAYASGLFDDWTATNGPKPFINRYFTAAAAVKSADIVVSSAAALQCARLYLGPYTEATYQMSAGASLGTITNSLVTRSDAFSRRPSRKGSGRRLAGDMVVLTEADREAWFNIGARLGITTSFVASLFPGDGGLKERNHTIFGAFEGQSPDMKLMNSKYDFSVAIEEL